MRFPTHIRAALALAFALLLSPSYAASPADQEVFANKILQLINAKKYDYALAATQKYLELEPDSGPVNRVLAHYYMKTDFETSNDLLRYRYPDDVGEKIINLLNKSLAINPSDEKAWALLVYTHALQNNVEPGKQALASAEALNKRDPWLEYNAALLAIRDNNLREAVDRLAPIAIDRRVAQGSDTKNIIRNSWIQLRDIALQEPSLDPLDSIRDGLVNRVDIEKLPEYLFDYDETASPILLVFSSQDTACTYCTPDLDELYQAAKYNKDNDSPLNIVYTSIEPWSDARYHSRILKSMGITGAPSHQVIHNGYHIHNLTKSRSRLETIRSFIDKPEQMLASGKPYVKALPREAHSHDQMYDEFAKYKKAKSEGYKAMAYVLEGSTWRLENVKELASQDEANALALANCNAKAEAAGLNKSCKLYARGRRIMDTYAVERSKARNAEQREMKQLREAKKTGKTNKPAANPVKQKQATGGDQGNGNEGGVALGGVPLGGAGFAAAAIKAYGVSEEHYKALAIAQDAAASVAGLASKAITQSRAVASAIDMCETARAEYAIEAECILHSIGKKQVSDQSTDAIAKLSAKQQKRNVKNSALNTSYKKYRKFSTDKAYAFSIDENDNWVYGMAFGKRGTDKATAAALEKCEEKRVQKDLPNECQILILNSKFVEQP